MQIAAFFESFADCNGTFLMMTTIRRKAGKLADITAYDMSRKRLRETEQPRRRTVR
jgi:hypothetical protein